MIRDFTRTQYYPYSEYKHPRSHFALDAYVAIATKHMYKAKNYFEMHNYRIYPQTLPPKVTLKYVQ